MVCMIVFFFFLLIFFNYGQILTARYIHKMAKKKHYLYTSENQDVKFLEKKKNNNNLSDLSAYSTQKLIPWKYQ